MDRTDDHATTRVLVVEDQRTLAEALMIAINAQPDLECVGTASTADEALLLADAHRPDVVLMDIHLPGADGIAGTRRIKEHHPAARVFILTADASPAQFSGALDAGATGFLAKDGPFRDVLATIRTRPGSRALVAGDTFAALTAELRRGGDERPETADPAPDRPCLTGREREILGLMYEGFGSLEIAERLAVSRHTVFGHIKRIMTKLRVHSRREAIEVATRTGLLP